MKMRWLVMIMICVAPTEMKLEWKIRSSIMKEDLTTQGAGLKRKDRLVLPQHNGPYLTYISNFIWHSDVICSAVMETSIKKEN